MWGGYAAMSPSLEWGTSSCNIRGVYFPKKSFPPFGKSFFLGKINEFLGKINEFLGKIIDCLEKVSKRMKKLACHTFIFSP